MYLESSVLLAQLFNGNSVSAIPKYFSSGLLVGGTTALYAIFVFKYLLLIGHSALFLPFHTWLLEIV